MIYYISDLHFGHEKVIVMDNRPFEDVEEMDSELIRRWNERVTDNDDVYIVGDVTYHSQNPAKWYLKQLKGKKHLISGNHDWKIAKDEDVANCFESVEKMESIDDNGRSVCLCHYPIAEWYGKRYGGYHVFGHIHCRRDEVYEFMSRFDKALNAGCMINGYRPVTLDELIENNVRFPQEAEKAGE